MKKLWLIAATMIALIALAAPIKIVAADEDFVEFAANDEDVFLDEGDSDFSAMAPDAGGSADAGTPPKDEAPMPPSNADADVMTPEPADGGSPAFAAPSEDSSGEDASMPAAKPEKKAKKAKKTAAAEPKKAKKAKPAAVAKKSKKSSGGGMFVVTRDSCPMMREPASEGEPMITVKPSKKIWVEKVDEQWVRGFNKAGEPGYISKDCVD